METTTETAPVTTETVTTDTSGDVSDTTTQAAPEQPPETVPEAPKEEPKPVPPKRDYKELLARQTKERKLRQLESRVKEKAARAAAYEKALEEGRSDPLGFLERQFGQNFETLARKRAGMWDPKEETPKDPHVETLSKELETLKKAEQERQTALEKAAADARTQAHISKVNEKIISANLDAYECIVATANAGRGQEVTDLYFDLRSQICQAEGRNQLALDEERAIVDRVEEILLEKAVAQAQYVKSLKKLQATAPKETVTTTVETKTATPTGKPNTRQVPPTLTNSSTTRVPSSPEQDAPEEETREERIRRISSKLDSR